jgi:hypothetical protein
MGGSSGYRGQVERVSHEASVNRSARYLVGFRNEDGTLDTVSVWASSPDDAVGAAQSWLEESQELSLTRSEHETQLVGSEPASSDLGVASSSETVEHRRYSRSGAPLSTLFRADVDHLRRLTNRMRSDEGRSWTLLRTLLRDKGLDPRKAVVVGLQPDDEEPEAGTTVVCEGHRVFSFFVSTHPEMDQGLPRLSTDASFQMTPGPALIELPPLEPWNPLVRAGFELIEEEHG